MIRKRKTLPLLEQVLITDAGAEGNAVARINEKVLFVPFAVPGDVVDVQVVKKKKSYLEGRVVRFHQLSEKRAEPVCEHFGVCGGCKWQHMAYEHQLFYKQKQVTDNLIRIGKLDLPEISPIMGAAETTYYRNKLEYTFCSRKWLVDFNRDMPDAGLDMRALGFHMPGMFDRVLEIRNCYLQQAPSNDIRQALQAFALEQGYSFYDPRNKAGFLRNLIIRTTSTGELMVIVVFGGDQPEEIARVMDFVKAGFPQITSLFYIVNLKVNDTVADQQPLLYAGKDHIVEQLDGLQFMISPLSFFQTNTAQALQLYEATKALAGLDGSQLVYDLYTGAGTIGLFVAGRSRKVIGIEYVSAAIDDARKNATLNGIENAAFYAGDMAQVLTPDFVLQNGRPDVVITDPPRAGMHKEVVGQILQMAPERVVYVSCNAATQARDLDLMRDLYAVKAVQPVDMFPHTHHVENVVLLVKK